MDLKKSDRAHEKDILYTNILQSNNLFIHIISATKTDQISQMDNRSGEEMNETKPYIIDSQSPASR